MNRPFKHIEEETKMKGNDKLIAALNGLLTDELTAINQYMVHSEMCENWGYNKLHKAIRSQSIDEMKHAEWLIERILFLEGTPQVSKLNQMRIGKSVKDMLTNDQDIEVQGIQAYNAAIKLAREVADEGTVELLTKIVKMEEGHVDWAEMQRDQIEQMGYERYLANQTEGAS